MRFYGTLLVQTTLFFTVLCSLIPTPHCDCHDKHDTQSKANISHDRVHLPPIYVEIFFPAALGTPMCVLYSPLEWCWIGGGKRRRHWKTGSKTFCGCCLISSQMVGYFSGNGCGYFHWPMIPWNSPCNAHARCTFLRSYYLPEASTPAINISDSWDTSVLGSWSLPLNELTVDT